MELIVCVKRVPLCAEAEILVDETGKGIRQEKLSFDLNDWDNYALEEALLIKEKLRGTLTVISMGPPPVDEVLRRCLAKGADRAIRIYHPAMERSDGITIAKILARAIQKLGLKYDLILTGAQAEDDGYGCVGQALAELLGIPCASLVTKIDEISQHRIKLRRELEAGMEESIELKLPALLTIQTGINEPRYVSIMGIRRAMKLPITLLELDQLGLTPDQVGEPGSNTFLEKLYVPPVERVAEFIKGDPETMVAKLLEILRSKGFA